jgi:hypothetical protein
MGADRDPAGTPALTPAVRRTRAWFEVNSGWAPPDAETLADWLLEGGSRCPDDCWAAADGECPHGLATWATLLALQAVEDDAARSGAPPRRTPPAEPAARSPLAGPGPPR